MKDVHIDANAMNRCTLFCVTFFYFVELVKRKVHESIGWNVVNFRAGLSRPSYARFQVVAKVSRSYDQYFMQWIIYFSAQFPCIRELTFTYCSYAGPFKFILAKHALLMLC